ncbi:MAG TPA: ATP-binding protein [Armatimonadota bacterium]|nr:ATP-binding protein [Armatimonadota bacterium]
MKRTHLSHPRNPTIARVLFRRGLIEQWGRGTQKIVELCRTAGQPEPEFEESAGAVTVRFLPSGYHPPLRVSHDLTERQRRILLVLSGGAEWTLAELSRAMPNPPSERTMRRELQLLSGVGLVGSRGRGKYLRWWLNRSTE